MSKSVSRIISNVLRVAIGGLWVASGVLHLQNVPAHFVAIANYRILPTEFSQVLAFVLPCLHVIIGVTLLLGKKKGTGVVFRNYPRPLFLAMRQL